MACKVLGATLVLLGSYGLGLSFAGLGVRRAAELAGLIRGFTLWAGEAGLGSIPLPGICMEVGERIPGSAGELFLAAGKKMEEGCMDSAQEIWSAAMAQVMPKSALRKEDWQMLSAFGRTLGFSQKEQQIAQAELTIQYLKEAYANQEEKNKKDIRMYRALGVLGGMMVLVVLF